MSEASDFVHDLRQIFQNHANPDNAGPMKKYMRNQFDFLGIKTPERRKLVNQSYGNYKPLSMEDCRTMATMLWQQEEREFQYAALTLLEKKKNGLKPADLNLLQTLITNKSWWDTVDHIAAKLVGHLVREYPILTSDMNEWNTSDNLWIVRTSILYQLKYKEHTDSSLLFRFIKNHQDSKEFFIQKAMGWALREFAKTNPGIVAEFITKEKNQLPSLTIREGSKHLDL